MTDYEQTYDEFWKSIIEKDGVLDLDQLKRELHDFRNLMRSAGEVYCAVTDNRISKPNTAASAVIAEFEDYVQRLIDEGIKEAAEDEGGD